MGATKGRRNLQKQRVWRKIFPNSFLFTRILSESLGRSKSLATLVWREEIPVEISFFCFGRVFHSYFRERRKENRILGG
jgi:hypothetical protein